MKLLIRMKLFTIEFYLCFLLVYNLSILKYLIDDTVHRLKYMSLYLSINIGFYACFKVLEKKFDKRGW